jgi:hypothetical protein
MSSDLQDRLIHFSKMRKLWNEIWGYDAKGYMGRKRCYHRNERWDPWFDKCEHSEQMRQARVDHRLAYKRRYDLSRHRLHQ